MSLFKKKEIIVKKNSGKTKIEFRNNFEKDSHDKSSRKGTQGLGQRIPDRETPIFQLAEGTIWTGCTDQLAKQVSWIEQSRPTRRTGELDGPSRPTRRTGELDRTCSPNRPFSELDQSSCIRLVLVAPPFGIGSN